MVQCSRDIAGGRSGRTALSSHARYRETRSSVRWRLPDRRFHAIQLHEFRRPQNLHPNTIQVTGTKQTYPRRMAHFLAGAGRVRRDSAAHEAGQRRLVPGHGRRGLSEPAEHPDRSAGPGPDPFRRPHLQDELPGHAGLASRRKTPTSRIATIQVDPREAAPLRRRGDRARITGSRGFEEKPTHGNPARSRFDPTMVSASMGIYVFNTQVLIDELLADAADPDFLARFRQRHSAEVPRAAPRGGVGLPRYERQSRALLARRGHARRLLRSQHGSGGGVAGVQPLRPATGRFARARFRRRRRNSFSRRKASGWAWRSIRSSRRAASFPADA